MPTDTELAAARLPAAAYAVALAHRALLAAGTAPTIEKLMAATNLSRSAVYAARDVLRERWPDEYNGALANPVQIRPARTNAPARLGPKIDQGALILDAQPSSTLAPYRTALAEHALAQDGRRSWDVYADVYSPAWDTVLALVPDDQDPTNDLIGLANDYVTRMTADLDVTIDRALVALLIRQWGKAGLFGLHKALGSTDDHSMKDWYRYARAVASRVTADLKEQPA